MKSSLLLQEPTLQVLPSLAVAVGLEQAIVIQQLYFLLGKGFGKVLGDGDRYIYNTYEEWQQQYFPWWSPRTVQRIFIDLEKKHWVVTQQPEGSLSRRKYYRLCHGQIEKLTYQFLEEHKGDHQRDRVVEGAKNGSSSCQTGMMERAKNGCSSYRDNSKDNAEITARREDPRPFEHYEDPWQTLPVPENGKVECWRMRQAYRKGTDLFFGDGTPWLKPDCALDDFPERKTAWAGPRMLKDGRIVIGPIVKRDTGKNI